MQALQHCSTEPRVSYVDCQTARNIARLPGFIDALAMFPLLEKNHSGANNYFGLLARERCTLYQVAVVSTIILEDSTRSYYFTTKPVRPF